jgi:hypothetical protein
LFFGSIAACHQIRSSAPSTRLLLVSGRPDCDHLRPGQAIIGCLDQPASTLIRHRANSSMARIRCER